LVVPTNQGPIFFWRSVDKTVAQRVPASFTDHLRSSAILLFVERTLASLVPSADDFLRLEVEEVGWVLLVHLASLGDNSGDGRVWNGGRISQYNFFNWLDQQPVYGTRREDVNRALMEAWGWLQHEGFLVREVGSGGSESFFVSRRAKQLQTRTDFDAYRKAGLLPRGQLHAQIAARVYPAFLRGEYDTAVFQAFREVEIGVRAAGGFPAELVGVDLMRQAFKTINRPSQPIQDPGPLTDTNLPVAEQEAMAHLFAGAIGLYKNPQSHRYVPTLANEAAEVILFASHLLRIVDSVTRPRPQSTP
jgi:uncharacterized protein (TIGR02391 family)